MKFHLSVLVFISLSLAVSADNDTPACEVCGCSWCDDDQEYSMGNPQGSFNLLEYFSAYQDDEFNATTAEELAADIPLDTFPCFLMEFQGIGVSEEHCVDEFRLNPVMREACGCPALPPTPPGVVNIYAQHQEQQENDTTGTVSEQEQEDHTPCEICGCSWCDEEEDGVSYSMSNPQGSLDLREFMAAYEPLDPSGNFTAEQGLAELPELPMDAFPCFIFDLIMRDGGVNEEHCNDHIRLNPFMRDTCGCPALPPLPLGVVNVFESAVTAPPEPTNTESTTATTTTTTAAATTTSSSSQGVTTTGPRDQQDSIEAKSDSSDNLVAIVAVALGLLVVALGVLMHVSRRRQQQKQLAGAATTAHIVVDDTMTMTEAVEEMDDADNTAAVKFSIMA